MICFDTKIAQSGYTTADIAQMAGVRMAAVSDYRARRYDKCGRAAKEAIDEVLMNLGIKKRPDPKRAVRRKLKQFHRDANNPRLIAELTAGHLQDSSPADCKSADGIPTRDEIHEQIFGVIR